MKTSLPILASLVVTFFGTQLYEAQTPPQPKSYQFINGRWFDGKAFQQKVVYSVDGLLKTKKPSRIDEVIDLKDGFVIPPFGDAHNHHFDSSANIDQHVSMYLRNGVFYAKVLTDVRKRAARVAGKVNIPSSVDVVYAHGGLTSSFGHPIETYEGLALLRKPGGFNAEEVQKVRNSHLVESDAYYIIDTANDLESKWPTILAGKPDIIKVYLLHSENYQEQLKRTDKVGDRGLDPKLVPLIVKKAHAARLRVSAHVDTVFDYRVALNAGVDEMAHMPGYYIFPQADPEKFRLTEADARETARRKIWVIPAPIYSELFDPRTKSYNAQITERTNAARNGNLQLLHRAGVEIAFGSDSFGRSPLKDMLYLRTFDIFSNLELLKIWCEETAKNIFPNRKIGKLREGYEASFLVLEGDPLADFEQVKNIRLRFKQGYMLDVTN